MWIGLVLVGAAFLIYISTRNGRSAIGQAAPMGAYLRAVENGASPEDAIFGAVNVLRYRPPWDALSEEELRASAAALAELPDPSLFTQVLAEVEETGELEHFRNTESLRRFVEFVRQRSAPRA